MLSLMERPDQVPALAPAYQREILFHVLKGPLGWMLRDMATPDTTLSGVGIAIQWLRETSPSRASCTFVRKIHSSCAT